MRTGIIVYVTGNDASMDPAVQKGRIMDLLKADQVEIVSLSHGYHDISDAWWKLTVRGMQRIMCVMAEISGMSDLRLTGRQLTLCG